MNTEQNKQAVQEAYRMYQNGDVASIVERCHDDCEWTSPDSDLIPMSGPFHGKPGVATTSPGWAAPCSPPASNPGNSSRKATRSS